LEDDATRTWRVWKYDDIERRFPMAQPLIIQYTNLLHQYRDTEAEPIKKFLKKHSQDHVFIRRAKTLNKVFKLKEQLVTSVN
jgi:hypothetical protein